MEKRKFHCPVKKEEIGIDDCKWCGTLADEQCCEALEAAVHREMYDALQERFGNSVGLAYDADGVWCQLGGALRLSAAYDSFEECVYLEANFLQYGGNHLLVPCGDVEGCVRMLEMLQSGNAAFVVKRGLLMSRCQYADGDTLRKDWHSLTRGFGVRLIDGQGMHKPKEYAAKHAIQE